MKKSYTYFFVIFFFISSFSQIFGQDIYDKMVKEICECIEKEKVKDASGIGSCFEELLVNNLIELKKHYSVQTMADLDLEKMGYKIGAKLIKECDYAIDNFLSGNVDSTKEVPKQQNLNCDDLKNGDFYYVNKIPEMGIVDTTFVTISKDMYLERMNNGRTYSLLKIKWKDDCKFSLEFRESNDPWKKEISNPGDIYEHEIMTNGEKSFLLTLFWRGKSNQFELFKLD